MLSEEFLPRVNYLKISLITAHLNLSKQQHKEFQETEVLTLLVRVLKSNDNIKVPPGGQQRPLACGLRHVPSIRV